MTISSQTRTAGPFIGNGVATGGSFTFKVFEETDLVGIETSDLGVDRDLVYGVDFSVTLNADQNVSPGGTIAYLIAGVPSLIPTNYALNFTSAVEPLQPVALTNAGGFFPNVINTALDRLTILVQQLTRSVNASIKFPLSDGTGFNSILANAETRANKGIRFNSLGELGLTLGDPDDAAGAAAAAAASAAAAAASAVTSGTNATNASISAAAAAASAASAAASAAGMKYRTCRAASTANVNIASAPASLDTIAGVVNDRWTLKDQSAPAENGIYVFNGAGVALTRAADMDTWAEVPGTAVVVQEGATNADTVWLCTSNDGGTLGVTAITFVDWSAVTINNSITNAKLAQMPTLTIKSNITGGTANAADNTLSAILDAVLGTGRGSLMMRGASAWSILAPGAANTYLRGNGVGADLTFAALPATGVVTVKQQLITATGTYTPNTGMLYALVRMVGGGGGGAKCAGSNQYSGGGGAGGYCERLFTAAEIGANQSVTVGALGAGNTAGGGGAGGTGGNTSFGAFMTANGGTGGVAASSSAAGSGVLGGGGGGASGGTFNQQGDSGGCGFSITATNGVCGRGASGPFGTGGAELVNTSAVGNAATGYGAGGGSGGNNSNNGGNGSAGVIHVYEFCSQ